MRVAPLLALLVLACEPETVVDAGAGADAGLDAGGATDAGPGDAGAAADAGSDAGRRPWATVTVDSFEVQELPDVSCDRIGDEVTVVAASLIDVYRLELTLGFTDFASNGIDLGPYTHDLLLRPGFGDVTYAPGSGRGTYDTSDGATCTLSVTDATDGWLQATFSCDRLLDRIPVEMPRIDITGELTCLVE